MTKKLSKKQEANPFQTLKHKSGVNSYLGDLLCDDFYKEEIKPMDNERIWAKTMYQNAEAYMILRPAYAYKHEGEFLWLGDDKGEIHPKDYVELLNKHKKEREENPDIVIYDYANDYEKGIFYKDVATKLPSEPSVNATALPAGCYKYSFNSQMGEFLITMIPRKENIAPLHGITRSVLENVKNFCKKEDLFKQLGVCYKRGYLLYGDGGQGKTATIRELLNDDVFKDAIIIYLDFIPTDTFIENLKLSLGNRLKVFIFEEMAATLAKDGLDRILNFLDGETSLTKTIFFATTNYINQFPENLTSRPSRFDLVVKFDNPNAPDRQELFKFFLNTEVDESIIAASEGLSIAMIKEICLDSLINDKVLTDCLKDMKNRKTLAKNAFKQDGMGFGNRQEIKLI